MSDGLRVLIVDDELPVRRFLRHAIEGQGWRALEAEKGSEALSLAAQYVPDVILLDLGLPDQDGVDVCRALRTWFRGPILVISARGEEGAKVRALDEGADDYLTKPFGVPELFARIRVALRHSVHTTDRSEPRLVVADLELDVAAHRVWCAREELHLTDTEFRVLNVLARYAGKVVTQRLMTREVWGPNTVDKSHDIRVHVAALRRKLDAIVGRKAQIQTELGVGYRLVGE